MSIRAVFISVCVMTTVLSCAAVTVVWVVFLGAPIRSVDVMPIGMTTLGCVAFAVTIAYRFAQSMRRRLYDLEEAASLIASGRLQHRVQTMGDTDEIGRVTDQFNLMGEKLEEQVRLLQQLADENHTLAEEAEEAAALRERQILSRELHDSVSQQLFALSMLASAAKRYHSTSPEKLEPTLSQLEELATAAQREMRALLLHLRPVDLDGRNFTEAVAAFLQAVEERHQLGCKLQIGGDIELPGSVETQLFRILQESIANVLKHADATEVSVQIASDRTLFTMRILDNGRGISASKNEVQDSYGLKAMRERAVSLGGRLDIWQRSKGTAVEVHIPIV